MKAFPLADPEKGEMTDTRLGLDKTAEGIVFHLLDPFGDVMLSSPRIHMQQCYGLAHKHEPIRAANFKMGYEIDFDAYRVSFFKAGEWVPFRCMPSEQIDLIIGSENKTD